MVPLPFGSFDDPETGRFRIRLVNVEASSYRVAREYMIRLDPEDAAFLGRMKAGALFVNAGRGKTVDTNALLEALRAGRIRAALDVTDPEPLPEGHPLWHAPNILITPHIAGSTRRWLSRSYRFAGEQIRRYAAGQPLLGVES